MSGPLEIGTVLNQRYKITGFLGEGGFASVFLGFDKLIQREVAIKVLAILDKLPDPSQRDYLLQRFYNEARLSARIHHDNIVNIYDMGVIDGMDRPYIVMERLHGHDLERELVDYGAMHPERTVHIFMRCLDALAEGHEQGIIHKDLKPSNLFLINPRTERENVRVLDFGIARLIDSDAKLTSTNQMIGTAQYLAPEYIHHKEVGPALDIYQMGLILVEALTGEPVVDDDNPLACVVVHSKGDLHFPMEVQKSPLWPVVAKATAYKPVERYASARQMRKALEELLPEVRKMDYLRTPSQQFELMVGSVLTADGQEEKLDLGPPSTVFSVDGFMEPEEMDQAPVRGDASTAAAPRAQVEALLGEMEPDASTTAPEPLRPAAIPTQRVQGVSQAQDEEQGSRRNAIMLVVTLVLAVAVLATGAVVYKQVTAPVAPQPDPDALARPDAGQATEPGAQEADAGSQEADAQVAAISPDQGQEPPAQADAGAQEADAAPEEAPPVEISVELITRPAGALVLEEGARLGKTPFKLTFAGAQAEPRQLSLRLRGYKAQEVTLTPEDAPSHQVNLSKKGAPRGNGGGNGGGDNGSLIPE